MVEVLYPDGDSVTAAFLGWIGETGGGAVVLQSGCGMVKAVGEGWIEALGVVGPEFLVVVC